MWLRLAPTLLLFLTAALARWAPASIVTGLGTLFTDLPASPALAVVSTLWPWELATTAALLLGAVLARHVGGPLSTVAAALIVLDLLKVNTGLNPTTEASFYDLRPEVARMLADVSKSDERIYSYGVAHSPPLRWVPEIASRNRDVWLYYMDRQSLLPRLHVLDGFQSSFDVDRMGWAPPGATLTVQEANPRRFREHYERLRRGNVRWVLSFAPLPDDLTTPRGEVSLPEVRDPLRLYEVRGAVPRAYAVTREGREESGEVPTALGSVTYERPDPHTVVLGYEGPAARLVVVEGFDAGWRVESADGSEAPLLRARDRYWAIPTQGGTAGTRSDTDRVGSSRRWPQPRSERSGRSRWRSGRRAALDSARRSERRSSSRKLLNTLIAPLIWLSSCGNCDEPLPLRPTIERVEITANPIFDESAASSWPYRVANQLHVRTKEDVIRRELLFEPGGDVDADLMAQTERNLRGQPFLRDARVAVAEGENGEQVVSVETFDSWSTSPELKLAKLGNRWVWAVGVSETNLLGRGKQVQIARRADLERQEKHVAYRDPRVLGSRIASSVSYSSRSDGSRGELAVSRPFFSLQTPLAFYARLEGFDQLDSLYADGERIDQLAHNRRWGDFELARAVARRSRSAVRVHAAYRFREDEVDGDPRDFGIAELGISTTQHEFIKLTHVDRFESPEDFNLGNQAGVFGGVSTPTLGGEQGTSWFLRLYDEVGLRVAAGQMVRVKASWTIRHRRDGWENGRLQVRLQYLNKLSPRWLVMLLGGFTHGHELDPEIQITLGAQNGLRGYPVHQFVGTRAMVFNAETRVFVADDVKQLASFALAAFVDTGYAWPGGSSVALRDFRTNIGIGLLVGPNRLAGGGAGLRVDLTYALDDIAGRSRWLVSAGSSIGF